MSIIRTDANQITEVLLYSEKYSRTYFCDYVIMPVGDRDYVTRAGPTEHGDRERSFIVGDNARARLIHIHIFCIEYRNGWRYEYSASTLIQWHCL